MVQLDSFDDNNRTIHVKKLLSRYRKGIYDLPTLAIKLLDVPELDAADVIQNFIRHRARLKRYQYACPTGY